MSYGQDWILSDITTGSSHVCMSADGTVAYATVYNTGIYKSVDYGHTWSLLSAGANGYVDIGCSGDGVYVYAIDAANQLVRSNDSGSTWTTTTPSTLSKRSVACSDDGAYAYIHGGSNGIYQSTDYGANWTRIITSGTFPSSNSAMQCSADGQFVIVGNAPSGGTDAALLISNYGASSSWITNVPIGTINTVAMSADGQGLLLGYYNGALRVSSDQGATWAEYALNKGWRDASCSADFSQIIVGVQSQKPYVSEDGGATWAQVTGTAPSMDWSSIAQSDDGSVLIGSGGGVYYSGTVTPPTSAQLYRLTAESLSTSDVSVQLSLLAGEVLSASDIPAYLNRLVLEVLSSNVSNRRSKFFTFLIE